MFQRRLSLKYFEIRLKCVGYKKTLYWINNWIQKIVSMMISKIKIEIDFSHFLFTLTNVNK